MAVEQRQFVFVSHWAKFTGLGPDEGSITLSTKRVSGPDSEHASLRRVCFQTQGPVCVEFWYFKPGSGMINVYAERDTSRIGFLHIDGACPS